MAYRCGLKGNERASVPRSSSFKNAISCEENRLVLKMFQLRHVNQKIDTQIDEFVNIKVSVTTFEGFEF